MGGILSEHTLEIREETANSIQINGHDSDGVRDEGEMMMPGSVLGIPVLCAVTMDMAVRGENTL